MKSPFGSAKRSQKVFGESLSLGRKSSSRIKDESIGSNRAIFIFCTTLVFLLFGIGRLFDLQIIRGSYFQTLSEGNRIRRIPIKAARGEILDRNGVVLARNIPRYNIAKFSSGGVITELKEISREEALKFQAEDSGSVDTSLIIDVAREYPAKEAAAHILGYVNETNEEEVDTEVSCPDSQKSPYVRRYEIGDLVGRGGIEEAYECLLRGVNGEELVEVDSKGRIVRSLGRKEPIPGRSVKLAIDSALQQSAYESLLNAPNELGTAPLRESGEVVKGAVIAADPRTGEILALVSSPSFDPATLSSEYGKLTLDENRPLFNRAIAGVYPPGSTYKIVTSAGALEEGLVDGNWTFKDEGFISVGPYSYRNWYFTQYGRVEGEVNVVKALTRSTDTYYYKIGEMLGVERLGKWSSLLGYGEKTGIDISGEAPGVIPDEEWKLKVRGERWFLGNTYHMSIGQGDMLSTPLQVNLMTGIIASGGKKCRPHLLKEVSGNGKWQKVESRCEDVKLKPETLQLIRAGMVGACSEGGTAYPLFNFMPRVACKTGTAQFSGDKTHAWLTAYLLEGPREISVTALVEGGGEGSRIAAPVVKGFFESLFPQVQ